MNSRLYLLATLLLLAMCPDATDAKPAVPVPRKEAVGAAALTDVIGPVKAPFPMPQFRKPTFPPLTVNITEKGAQAGSKVTAAIQAAIDDVHDRGGGTVVVPPGEWRTGRISLKSNVNLHLQAEAALCFSGEVEDYRPAVFTRNEGVEVMSLGACVYANGQRNIAVTGKGKLIGPAKGGSVRKQVMNADVIEKVVPHDKPVDQRVYEGHDGSFIFLPMLLSPINCTDVYIEGISLENTAFWNIVPVYCDGVVIRGVTVNSVGIPRGDGIDVESSRNVLIEYCTLSCGDDCFTIKAGRGEDGLRVNRPTENVVVRYCLAREGHGAITCGSETAGMIRNLYVHDCVFEGTGAGIRFKTRRPRGGGGENLTYERIRMDLTGTAFTWDMLGSKQYVGALAERLPAREVNGLTPAYRNIVARDVIVERASQFVKVTGIPESPLSNVLIENVDVTAKLLFAAADIKGFTVRNATIRADDAQVTLVDGRDVLFDNVRWTIPGGAPAVTISGDRSDNVQFRDCVPPLPKDWRVPVWKK